MMKLMKLRVLTLLFASLIATAQVPESYSYNGTADRLIKLKVPTGKLVYFALISQDLLPRSTAIFTITDSNGIVDHCEIIYPQKKCLIRYEPTGGQRGKVVTGFVSVATRFTGSHSSGDTSWHIEVVR